MFEEMNLLTAEAIAAACDLSPQTVRKVFDGKPMRPETLSALAAYLGISPRKIAAKL